MGTSQNSISSASTKELVEGKVLCSHCKKGHYQPFDPKSKDDHYFTFDNCGSILHRDPVVEIY